MSVAITVSSKQHWVRFFAFDFAFDYCFVVQSMVSDGEGNLVSQNVLVGEKSKLPPAPRQTFRDL